MLENVPNIRDEENLRNDLVQCFLKDELDVQRTEMIFRSQMISGRGGFELSVQCSFYTVPSPYIFE